MNSSIWSHEEIEKFKNFKLSELGELSIRTDLVAVGLVTNSISIISVMVVLVIYYVLRLRQTTKIMLHRNLLFSYGALCSLGVFGVATTTHVRKSQIGCVVYLTLLQYFQYATFIWTLLEGIHLVIVLILVFEMRKKRHGLFMIFGWGVPAIVISTLYAVDWRAFWESKNCLNFGEKAWLTKGPVLAILTINFVLATFVIISIIRHQFRKEKQKREIKKSAVKAFLVLCPMLGLLWIFTILVDESLIFGYLSATLNGLTGFAFFLFHGLLDNKVQEKAKQSKYRIIRLLYAFVHRTDSVSMPSRSTRD